MAALNQPPDPLHGLPLPEVLSDETLAVLIENHYCGQLQHDHPPHDPVPDPDAIPDPPFRSRPPLQQHRRCWRRNVTDPFVSTAK